ncbi:MAG: SpoIIE family protein phosphatase [Flavobacteriales bacterium]|nr:SpoIIE family protein phosphatase [Flavobacteriales bacterium]
MKVLLALFLTSFCFFSIAQSNDELKELIKSSDGQQKAQYLIQLANNLKNDSPSESFGFAVDGLKYSDGNKSLEGAGNAIASQTALSLKKYDDAVAYGKKASEIFKSSDQKNYAVSVSTVADAYAAKGDWNNAITYDELGYNTYLALGKNKNAAYSAAGVAQAYQSKKDIKNGIKWFELAAEYFGKENDPANESQCLQSAGALYANYGDFENAKKLLVSALDIAKKYGLSNQGSIQKNLDVVSQNETISGNQTDYESQKEKETNDYIQSMEVNQAKSLAEIEMLSEEVQLAELKIKAKQDEANLLILQNQKLTWEAEQALMQKDLATAEADKAVAIADKAEAEKAAEMAKSQNLYIIIIGMSLIVIMILFGFILKNNSNKKLQSKNEEISLQRDEILKQSKNIQHSIDYATKIQQALLPSYTLFKEVVNDSFVFLKPKDNVSGDFFWFHKTNKGYIAAAADCTGHGVPGAFMSIIFSNLLDKAVIEDGIHSPEKILESICIMLTNKLADRKISGKEFKDGMDVAIIAVNNGNEVLYSGARNSIYIAKSDNDLLELKGTKRSVGVNNDKLDKPFELHKQILQKGDKIFMFSDGFPDQKGGEKGKKFYYQPFKELLHDISQKSIHGAASDLDKVYEKWRGKNEQYDDVLVVGIEVS